MGAYIKYIIAFGIIGGAGYLFYKLYSDSKTTESTGTGNTGGSTGGGTGRGTGGSTGGSTGGGTGNNTTNNLDKEINLDDIKGKTIQSYLDKIEKTDLSLKVTKRNYPSSYDQSKKTLSWYTQIKDYPNYNKNLMEETISPTDGQANLKVALAQLIVNWTIIRTLRLVVVTGKKDNLKVKKIVNTYLISGLIKEDGIYSEQLKRYVKILNDNVLSFTISQLRYKCESFLKDNFDNMLYFKQNWDLDMPTLRYYSEIEGRSLNPAYIPNIYLMFMEISKPKNEFDGD